MEIFFLFFVGGSKALRNLRRKQVKDVETASEDLKILLLKHDEKFKEILKRIQKLEEKSMEIEDLE